MEDAASRSTSSIQRHDSTSSSAASCQIHFVNVNDDTEEQLCLWGEEQLDTQIKDIHLQAFKMMDEGNLAPCWSGVELLQLDSGEGKIKGVFVLPVFRGPLFEHLVRHKCRVYGSPYIIWALKNQERLVRLDHPVYSNCMQGCLATITGLQTRKKDKIRKLIIYMGGFVKGSVINRTTHIVTNRDECSSEKCKVGVTGLPRRFVVASEWVEHCWANINLHLQPGGAGLAPICIARFGLPFIGACVVSSGFHTNIRAQLQELVEEGGGKYVGQMKRDECTHLISLKTSGPKYEMALAWENIKVVTKEWLTESRAQGIRLEEDSFCPPDPSRSNLGEAREKRTISTPVKDLAPSLIDPEVSHIPGVANLTLNSNMSMESRAASRAGPLRMPLLSQLSPVRDVSLQMNEVADPGLMKLIEEETEKSNHSTCNVPMIDIEPQPVPAENIDAEIEDEFDEEPDAEPIFEGLTFGVAGFTDVMTELIQSEITKFAGCVLESGEVAVLIVPLLVNHMKPEDIAKFTPKEIVTGRWMQVSVETRELADYDGEPVWRPLLQVESVRPLEGCVLCATTLDEVIKISIRNLAEAMGAKYQDHMLRKAQEYEGVWCEATTHLICSKATGSKYSAAKNWKIHRLNYFWIIDCLQSGRRLDEAEYCIESRSELKMKPMGENWLRKPLPTNPRLKSLRGNTKNNSSFSPMRPEVGSPMHKSTPNVRQLENSVSSMLDSPSEFLRSGYRPRFDLGNAEQLVGGPKEREFWQTSGCTEESLTTFVGRQLEEGAKKVLLADNLPNDRSVNYFSKMKSKCESNGGLVPVCDSPKLPPLANVVVSISSGLLYRQNSLFEEVKKLGGESSCDICSRTTHFVCEVNVIESSEQVIKARKMNAVFVTPEWLIECSKQGMRLNEHLYECNIISTPPRGRVTRSSTSATKRKSTETKTSTTKRSKTGERGTHSEGSVQKVVDFGPSDVNIQHIAQPQKARESEETEARNKLMQLMDSVANENISTRRSSQRSISPRKMPMQSVVTESTSSCLRRSSRNISSRHSTEIDGTAHIEWEDTKEIENAKKLRTSKEASQSYKIQPEDMAIMNLPEEQVDSLADFVVEEEAQPAVENQGVPEPEFTPDSNSQPICVPEERVRLKACDMHFMFTSTSRESKEKGMHIVKRLGANVVDCASFDPIVTHLIAESTSRSEKLLSGAAAGRWILHPLFLYESETLNKFGDECEFEWGSEYLRVKTGKNEPAELGTAAIKWRHKILSDGQGPFHNWVVLLYMEGPRQLSIKNLLSHGGAKTVFARKDLQGKDNKLVISENLTMAIVEDKKCGDWIKNKGDLEILVRSKVPCYETKYLMNYLLNSDKIDHSSHFIKAYKDSISK